MMHGQPVQHFSVKLPLRHELLHQGDEAPIVSAFEEMHHLMNHNVFEAFARFLRKFSVEPNAAGVFENRFLHAPAAGGQLRECTEGIGAAILDLKRRLLWRA